MSGNALVIIRTARLVLTPVDASNVTVLWRLMRAPYLREFQDIPRLPQERFADRLKRKSTALIRGASGRFEWLVTPQDTTEAIGWVSLRFSERNTTKGELGYSILAQWRGRGYASEAVAALVDHAFDAGVTRIVEAFCMPGNLGSRGVMRKAGFIERQLVRGGAIVRGRAIDVVRFDRLAPLREHETAKRAFTGAASPK